MEAPSACAACNRTIAPPPFPPAFLLHPTYSLHNRVNMRRPLWSSADVYAESVAAGNLPFPRACRIGKRGKLFANSLLHVFMLALALTCQVNLHFSSIFGLRYGASCILAALVSVCAGMDIPHLHSNCGVEPAVHLLHKCLPVQAWTSGRALAVQSCIFAS